MNERSETEEWEGMRVGYSTNMQTSFAGGTKRRPAVDRE